MHLFLVSYIKLNILCKWLNILHKFYVTMCTPENSLPWRSIPLWLPCQHPQSSVIPHQASHPTWPATPPGGREEWREGRRERERERGMDRWREGGKESDGGKKGGREPEWVREGPGAWGREGGREGAWWREGGKREGEGEKGRDRARERVCGGVGDSSWRSGLRSSSA